MYRHQLPNGLRYVTAPLEHLHSATIFVAFRSGPRYETEDDNGISHFFEHMLFRGSKRFPSALELNRAIEELGGTLNAATHVDFTAYDVTLPTENITQGLEYLADMFCHPALEGLDVEKKILVEEALEDLDEHGLDIDIDNVVRQQLFSPHSLGLKITGPIDNIRRFSVEELHAHHRQFYGARNAAICVAGAFDRAAIEHAIQNHFGQLPSGRRIAASPSCNGPTGTRVHSVTHSASQTEVRMTFPGCAIGDPRYVTLELLTRVLDDGMSARLHARICDERGLAYSAFARDEPYEDCGIFELGAAVVHENVPVLVDEFFDLMREFREHPVGEPEWSKAQRRYLWDLHTTLDNAPGVAGLYGVYALFNQRDTLTSLAERARSVRVQDLQALARDLFQPSNARVTCVGLLDDDAEEKIRAAMTSELR